MAQEGNTDAQPAMVSDQGLVFLLSFSGKQRESYDFWFGWHHKVRKFLCESWKKWSCVCFFLFFFFFMFQVLWSLSELGFLFVFFFMLRSFPENKQKVIWGLWFTLEISLILISNLFFFFSFLWVIVYFDWWFYVVFSAAKQKDKRFICFSSGKRLKEMIVAFFFLIEKFSLKTNWKL